MFDAVDLGESTKFNIEEEHYKEFCDSVAKGEKAAEKGGKQSDRLVFSYDWQRFLWAFILGIFVETRTPLKDKSKTPPFGAEVFKNRNRILKLMIGLVLQEKYSGDPSQLKVDFEAASEKGENLGKEIRVAIEEYANTGFAMMHRRSQEKPGYIENIELVVEDILNGQGWA